MAVKMQVSIFLAVMLCELIGRLYTNILVLKMHAVCSSEMPVSIYKSTQRHKQQD
jgi:hypothetical protein